MIISPASVHPSFNLKANEARATEFLTDSFVWNDNAVSTDIDFLNSRIFPTVLSEILYLIFCRSASSFLSGEVPYSPSFSYANLFFARALSDLSVSKDFSQLGLFFKSFFNFSRNF